MSRRRQALCPTPSKLVYADVDEARAAFIEESKLKYRTAAAYAYRCRWCGRWHRTNKPDGSGEHVALADP